VEAMSEQCASKEDRKWRDESNTAGVEELASCFLGSTLSFNGRPGRLASLAWLLSRRSLFWSVLFSFVTDPLYMMTGVTGGRCTEPQHR